MFLNFGNILKPQQTLSRSSGHGVARAIDRQLSGGFLGSSEMG